MKVCIRLELIETLELNYNNKMYIIVLFNSKVKVRSIIINEHEIHW